MKKTLLAQIIMVLLVSTYSYALSDFANDENIDDIDAICSQAPIPGLCDSWFKQVDTSNKMQEGDLNATLENTNNVENLELNLAKEENKQAKDRVASMWKNIASLLIIVTELVKIMYYLVILFVFLHIPYFYIKLLVWIQDMVIKVWTKR